MRATRLLAARLQAAGAVGLVLLASARITGATANLRPAGAAPTPPNTHTNTHTHNRFRMLVPYVRRFAPVHSGL